MASLVSTMITVNATDEESRDSQRIKSYIAKMEQVRQAIFNNLISFLKLQVPRHKMNCCVRFGNCFLRVPLMYQPCCLVPGCQGKLGELRKKQLTKPQKQFILSLGTYAYVSFQGDGLFSTRLEFPIEYLVWCDIN